MFDRLYEDWTTLKSFQGTRGVLKLMAKVIYLVRRHAKPRTTLIKKCAKASAEGIVATQPKNITRQMDAEAIAQIIEAEFAKEHFSGVAPSMGTGFVNGRVRDAHRISQSEIPCLIASSSSIQKGDTARER